MTDSVRLSWRLWQSTRRRDAAGRAYLVYATVMVAIVVVAPVARGLWVVATDPVVSLAIAPAAASVAAMLIVVSLWAAAIITGRSRGPVVLPPLLAHALGESPAPQHRSFARPVARAMAAATLLATGVATPVAASWVVAGTATLIAAGAFILGGAACGAVTVVCWLLGQTVSRRTGAAVVAALVVLSVLIIAVPAVASVTPLGWVMLAYAEAGATPAIVSLVVFAAFAATFVPVLLRRLHAGDVLAQSLRWDLALVHAGTLDVSSAGDTYRAVPHVGRHRPAVRALRPLPVRILVRDFVGAMRTPGRIVAAVVALAVAGALLGLAAAMPTWTIVLSAIAGVLAYAGAGALSDGIRHVADAAASAPLYGVSDLTLMASHALFPLTVAVIMLVLTAIITGPGLPTAVSAGVVALGAVAMRIADAVKPPLPTSLLMPLSTPMGDLAAGARIAWALDGVLLTACVGVAAVAMWHAPWGIVLALGVVVTVVVRRWFTR